MTVLVVRHAVAIGRSAWSHADVDRPLDERGVAQAAGLVELLREFKIDSILSSPSARCVDTVRPLAAACDLSVDVVPQLAEGQRDAAATLAGSNGPGALVLCSHGDVIPPLVKALARFQGDGEMACAKGSTWVIEDDGGERPRLRYLPPPA